MFPSNWEHSFRNIWLLGSFLWRHHQNSRYMLYLINNIKMDIPVSTVILSTTNNSSMLSHYFTSIPFWFFKNINVNGLDFRMIADAIYKVKVRCKNWSYILWAFWQLLRWKHEKNILNECYYFCCELRFVFYYFAQTA